MDSIFSQGSGLIAIITIAVGAPLLLYFHKPPAMQDKAFDLRQQILIINCKDLTSGQPLLDKNNARAMPNQRLKTTFGIDNIFTTQDTEWASEFRKAAVHTLKKALSIDSASQGGIPDWSLLVESMKSAVQQHLQAEEKSVNLAKLVQFVTLKVSIGYLFDVPEQILRTNKDGVTSIAKRINELWIESKNDSGDKNAPMWHEEQSIIQNLLTIIPNRDPRNPRDNPMNLILPAYETMWRAVFRGLLEVYFRNAQKYENADYKDLLTTYLDDPSNAKSWKTLDDDLNYPHMVAALDIVKEILRLYPPTRRIYRKYPDREVFVSADLEEMQRNRNLAGDDPQAFRPARWLEIKQRFLRNQGDCETKDLQALKGFEEDLGFMPFARVCPAGTRTTNAFGWRMIALLTGSLIQGLDGLDGKWTVRAGKKRDQLPPYGKALNSGREDYLSLFYEKSG